MTLYDRVCGCEIEKEEDDLRGSLTFESSQQPHRRGYFPTNPTWTFVLSWG